MTAQSARVAPFQAAPLSPFAAQVQNALCNRAMPWSYTLGNTPLRVSVLPFFTPFTPSYSVNFACGDEILTLEFSGKSFITRHPALENIAQDADIPEEILLGILSLQSEELCQGLQNFLKTSVSVKNIAKPQEEQNSKNPQHNIALRVLLPQTEHFAEEECILLVSFSSQAMVTMLVNSIAMLPERPTEIANDIPIFANIIAGTMQLSKKELYALEENDILLPEHYFADKGKARLSITQTTGQTLVAECTLSENSITVNEVPVVPKEQSMSDETTAETSAATTENANAESVSKDDIAISVSFELGRRTLSMKDLESLGAGYTFVLGNSSMEQVDICANGACIGKGRIVDINGSIGVQISKIN